MTKNTTTMIQYVVETLTRDDAIQALADLSKQDGYLGGRALPCGPGKPHRAQAFFRADGVQPGDALPDDCRLVVVSDGMREALGIASAAPSTESAPAPLQFFLVTMAPGHDDTPATSLPGVRRVEHHEDLLLLLVAEVGRDTDLDQRDAARLRVPAALDEDPNVLSYTCSMVPYARGARGE